MTTTQPTTTAPRSRQTSQSQLAVAWQQFKKNRLARFGGGVLILLYLIALFAGFVAPVSLNNYSTSNITAYHPPTPLHVRDVKTGAWVHPYVFNYTQQLNMNTFKNEYKPTDERCNVNLFVRGDSYKILGLISSDVHLFGTGNPNCQTYLWGADSFGRDLFSRCVYAAQISLTIGVGAVIVTYVLGLVMGSLAAFFGGWVDVIIMRLVEILSAIPSLFLLILLRAMFPININPIFALYVIIALLAIVSWGGLARVVRGQLMSTREADFVSAADALGASNARIIFRHMLPVLTTFFIVDLSLTIPGYILLESGLSFIGIGAVEPYASWGSLITDAQAGGLATLTQRPWTMIPGFLIVLTVMCWQLLGDGLRDAFDPRRRR